MGRRGFPPDPEPKHNLIGCIGQTSYSMSEADYAIEPG